MSTYKSFAVIGAGGIGEPIVKALLAKGVSVLVISRPGSPTGDKFSAEAKVATVDVKSVPDLASVLREHDVQVVISAVGFSGLSDQIIFAEAAKLAGVKLFVPSEFGLPTVGYTEGLFGIKNKLAEDLEEIVLPYVRIFTGIFIESIPAIAGVASGKFRVYKKGETKGSFTAKEDIAGFTAHVLTTLPPSKLNNAIFRIEGAHITFKEIAALYGDKVQVEHVDSFPNETLTKILENYDLGRGATGGDSNELWEGHSWKSVKEVLNIGS